MAQHRILIADRNLEFIETAAAVLAEQGVEVLPLQSGSKVVGLCRLERPEAALVGLDLEGISGLEVCAQLKADDSALPVVLMMSKSDQNPAELAQKARADNYLIRPLKSSELQYCVRGLLRLRTLLRDQAVSGRLGAGTTERLGTVSLDVFNRFLAIEVRRADRYGFPLTVLAIRLDPLPKSFDKAWAKALDDQLGPALVSAVRGCVRDTDLSTVPAAHQALVLMPHTDIAGARIVAERIRAQMASQPYHFGRTQIQPTVSIGVALSHGNKVKADELIGTARNRRDEAAAAGGNRVAFS